MVPLQAGFLGDEPGMYEGFCRVLTAHRVGPSEAGHQAERETEEGSHQLGASSAALTRHPLQDEIGVRVDQMHLVQVGA
jgi:hypothetical protein